MTTERAALQDLPKFVARVEHHPPALKLPPRTTWPCPCCGRVEQIDDPTGLCIDCWRIVVLLPANWRR